MHVLSGDLFVGKPFLAQLCGVGCQQEKAQEPLVGGGRCWEATKIVNTHPRLGGGKGSHSIPTTPGHHPRAPGPPGAPCWQRRRWWRRKPFSWGVAHGKEPHGAAPGPDRRQREERPRGALGCGGTKVPFWKGGCSG